MLQSHIVIRAHRIRRFRLAAACVLLLALGGAAVSAQGNPPAFGQVGWRTVELPGLGSSFDRYLPQGVDIQAGTPLVVFLHDTAMDRASYRDSLRAAADQLRLVVALPAASTSRGWGFGDDAAIVEATIAAVSDEIEIQPGKVAIAGHGSGATYAYLLAYLSELHLSAVFAMSPSFLPVSAVLDPRYTPPIRMYHGANDTAAGRDAAKLRDQWELLGVEWELDAPAGFGHSTWPEESILDGFRFLVDRTAPTETTPPCTGGASSLCLHQGRFVVEVSFKESPQRVGRASVAAPRTKDSGLFFFYEPSNWEILTKVLDGCKVNGHYWVFASASTSLDYRVTVTDLEKNETVQYRHWPDEPNESVTDVEALESCSEDEL